MQWVLVCTVVQGDPLNMKEARRLEGCLWQNKNVGPILEMPGLEEVCDNCFLNRTYKSR